MQILNSKPFNFLFWYQNQGGKGKVEWAEMVSSQRYFMRIPLLPINKWNLSMSLHIEVKLLIMNLLACLFCLILSLFCLFIDLCGCGNSFQECFLGPQPHEAPHGQEDTTARGFLPLILVPSVFWEYPDSNTHPDSQRQVPSSTAKIFLITLRESCPWTVYSWVVSARNLFILGIAVPKVHVKIPY